jgi:hypothetical protein
MTADAGHAPGPGASTPGQEAARRRLNSRRMHGDLTAARAPYPGTKIMRLVMTLMLSSLCLLTIAGSVLMLLLWQQDRSSGVLTTQIDRTWELFGYLREVERWVAFGVVPVALGWIVLATVNVRRATGLRRNPIVAAGSLLLGIGGVWFIGATQVADADGPLTRGVGIAIQAAFLAIPLVTLERVAEAAEARHRPLRATYLIAVIYLAHLQGLGGLSTTEETNDPEQWGRLGAYLLIGGLIQVLGTLSANEAARAIEEGTEHRYELRHRFGETLLAQAVRTR